MYILTFPGYGLYTQSERIPKLISDIYQHCWSRYFVHTVLITDFYVDLPKETMFFRIILCYPKINFWCKFGLIRFSGLNPGVGLVHRCFIKSSLLESGDPHTKWIFEISYYLLDTFSTIKYKRTENQIV